MYLKDNLNPSFFSYLFSLDGDGIKDYRLRLKNRDFKPTKGITNEAFTTHSTTQYRHDLCRL